MIDNCDTFTLSDSHIDIKATVNVYPFLSPRSYINNLMKPEVKTVSRFVNVHCVIHKRDLLQQYHM